MATGMKLPIQANRRGGAELIKATPQLEQTIRSGLQPNTSNNPFQRGGGVDIGIPESIVFRVNSEQAVALARRSIQLFFKRLRALDLAKLSRGSEGLKVTSEGSDLVARIRFVDLEADREQEIVSNLEGNTLASTNVNSSG